MKKHSTYILTPGRSMRIAYKPRRVMKKETNQPTLTTQLIIKEWVKDEDGFVGLGSSFKLSCHNENSALQAAANHLYGVLRLKGMASEWPKCPKETFVKHILKKFSTVAEFNRGNIWDEEGVWSYETHIITSTK